MGNDGNEAGDEGGGVIKLAREGWILGCAGIDSGSVGSEGEIDEDVMPISCATLKGGTNSVWSYQQGRDSPPTGSTYV